jgi:hypothetical protein
MEGINARAIMTVVTFVLLIGIAIFVGDFIIVRVTGLPANDAPLYVRAPVHAVTLGGVIYAAVKYFKGILS